MGRQEHACTKSETFSGSISRRQMKKVQMLDENPKNSSKNP